MRGVSDAQAQLRDVTGATRLAGADEARQFAATVAEIVRRHAPPDPWKPGTAASDANRVLDEALREAGWDDMGTDETLLPLAAPAGRELGRAFASLAPIDRLLGGALRTGNLARYAEPGCVLVEPRAGLLQVSRARGLEHIGYTDALGVAQVGAAEHEAGAAAAGADGATQVGATAAAANAGGPGVGDPTRRMDAWCAASTGYLAGLAEESLRLALEHARSRRAFGSPLAALEPVQQMLADAATLVDGLTLLSADSPGADALAHAGEAAERAVAICMQVTGALGFTMEFPLQRAYRRARSARAWADAALLTWDGSPHAAAPSVAAPRDAPVPASPALDAGRDGRLPLAGLRVLDYGQYVASPFATMLLADLGADVVKVEPPRGDEWRRYDPFEDGESRYFYALNRGKRSIALDLKTPEGRARSAELIASADAVVHNCLPERARQFGLDAESVRAVNPRCVSVCVSAFGSEGPDADRPAYDLIGQALSGLLLADPRPGDEVPRRTGGLALADFTAGLLAALAVTAGLLGRREQSAEIEVSLLGAALALQAQRFVSVSGLDSEGGTAFAGRAELDALTARAEALEALDPYYRAHACSDGFVALACLNSGQRLRVCELLGLEDEFAGNPQAEPAGEAERERRAAHVKAVEAGFARLAVRDAVAALAERRVPASEVRSLRQLFDDPQVVANGLVQTVEQPGVGPVRLLGSPFKVDGRPTSQGRPAPALGEHADELPRTPARR
jgi:crotonobetainyl-CoA:carnitine CoA-transferase CaiB-like acyl-CoA transferase